MLATIWMCTQEWSLISIRTAALTLATCHQALSCLSSFACPISVRSLRLPRTGTLMRMCSTAAEGGSRVSRSASGERGWSIRSSVSRSSATRGTLRRGLRAGRRAGERRLERRCRRRCGLGLAAELEVHQRPRGGDERPDHRVRDQAAEEVLELVRQPEEGERGDDRGGDPDPYADH